MKRPRPLRDLWHARSGAVLVEHLIVFVPTMFFCLATLQTLLLCAGDLVIRRAASAAARAAVVVLPDDPRRFGGVPLHQYQGARAAAVVKATKMILAADPHFALEGVSVSITGVRNGAPLTATVKARYQCFASFVNLVCGGSSRELTGTWTQVYQGADYAYE
ncbi:MAG TPA: hypothetical protein VK524_28400 [Polyangiaceae bacterium]|nr:hypothetical protein [Polyangiaceae bacterium]